MIVVDTSALIDSLSGLRRSAPVLRRMIARGHRLLLPSIVLYEWLRGPRMPQELEAQAALFPAESIAPFGADEARMAADLYRSVAKPRGREIDLAIGACAIAWGAAIWTLNPRDFADLPGVSLYEPSSE